MLERATACVEPRVNFFLRRIETPTRSRRVLHPSFWRHHGAGNRSIPEWWPAYLQDIREIPINRSQGPPRSANGLEVSNDDNPSTDQKLLNTTQIQNGNMYHLPRNGLGVLKEGRRAFSVCHNNRDATVADFPADESGEDEYFLPGDMPVPGAKYKSLDNAMPYPVGPAKMSFPGTMQQYPQKLSTSESLRALLDSLEPPAYDKAWRLFIRVKDQAQFAGDVLAYLSTSSHRVDLDHAIGAYKLIPTTDRSLQHYQAAIKAACGRKLKKLAVDIHREAIKRGFHAEVTNILLGFLVRNGLWQTAAKVWVELPLTQRSAAKPQNHGLWLEIDQYTDLPEQFLRMISRLEQNVAIFASERDQMLGLSVQLLYRIFLSSDIMASITGLGTLTLLDRFHRLGLLEPHHYFAGIRTLNRLASSRNRHQLAILLYRNLNMRFPKVRLPRSVLGSLIATLCDSDNNHVASRVILRRFAIDWGKPDPQAYQKVLSSCAQNGDNVNVHEVFAEYCADYGKPTDISYITPLIYVYARLGNIQETQSQFDRLKSEFGFEPDAYCWNILITAYARVRDNEGAFEKFQQMKRAGVVPNQSTYALLMSMCAKHGDTEAVYQLVEAARQQNISGTAGMVDSLVNSYCLNDQIEDAVNLVETATKMHLQGSATRMWNTLLRYHAFRADTDAVLRTQERMKEVSVSADGMTYAALMQSLISIGRTKDAASILRSLHFSKAVTATVFHYALVLYGYALEDNRDMVAVIYNEMCQRFPALGLSAKLSRLRSHAYRDIVVNDLRQAQVLQGKPMNRNLRLSNTLDFLAEILLSVNQSDLATKEPQPGLARRTPPEAFPSVYFEFLIGAFGRSGALRKAENVLSRYLALLEKGQFPASSNIPSIQLLITVMITSVQQKRFTTVEEYWEKALSIAMDKGRQLTLDLSDPIVGPNDSTFPTSRPDAAVSLQSSSQSSGYKLVNPFLDRGDVKILPAHRYSLASPLTQYMYSLSGQNLVGKLPQVVQRLEEMGFSLTSKNWNHYVQVLSYSDDADLELLAFRIFEEKLLPNMPHWELMKRSKWAKQRIVDGSGDLVIEEPVQRKFIEKFRPHTLIPTYWTMVYLGLALMKAQQRSLREEQPGLKAFRSHAPGTVNVVSRMPYLRERAQGLLLRGQVMKGDRRKRPRRPPEADRAGLRGSRSPLDHIPLEFDRRELAQLLHREPVSRPKLEADEEAPLQTAERLSGEIRRSPLVLEAAGRYERELEHMRRLRAEKQEKLRLMEQMREDAAHSGVMADEKHGEPYFEVSLHDQQPSLRVDNTGDLRAEEQQELLSAAVNRLAETKKTRQPAMTPDEAFDKRPAAILSAARRPKDAVRLQKLRRRRRRLQAIPLSIASFRRSLSRKITGALTTRQPILRIPNRLRKAFTINRAARRARTRQRLPRQDRSKARIRNTQNPGSSDIGELEDTSSESLIK